MSEPLRVVEGVEAIDGREDLLALVAEVRRRIEGGEVTSLAMSWTSPEHGVCSAWSSPQASRCHLLMAAVHSTAFQIHVSQLKYTAPLPSPEKGG